MKHYLLNHQPQKGLQAACAQQGQAPTCNVRGKGRTSASPKTLTRILLVLLTMLLLPSAAWGQTTYQGGAYDPGSGTWGDWNIGTYQVNELIPSGTGPLQVKVPTGNGTSSITLSLAQTKNTTEKICKIYISTNTSTGVELASAKIVSSDGQTEYKNLIESIDKYGSMWNYYANTPIEWDAGGKIVFTLNFAQDDSAEKTYEISSAEVATGTPYDLIVGGITVTNVNEENVTAKTIWDGTTNVPQISFTSDGNSNTLTLSGAELTSGIESGLGDLTINLTVSSSSIGLDDQAVGTGIKSTNNGTLTFKGEKSLTITATDYTILGFNSINYDTGVYAETTSPYVWGPKDGQSEPNCLHYNGTPLKWLKISNQETYPIWIGGSQFYYNRDDLGCSFTPYNATDNTPATLSLSSSHIDNVIWGGNTDLVIEVYGDNTISRSFENDGDLVPAIKSVNSCNLTINTLDASESASLILSSYYQDETTQGITNADPIIDGFSKITASNFTSSESTDNDGIKYTTYMYQAPPIKVAGVLPDSEGNFSGISGVTFKPATIGVDQSSSTPATLTLNGATINGKIEWNSSDNLTIALNGKNTIVSEEGGELFKSENTCTLNIVKADNAESATLKYDSYSESDGKIANATTYFSKFSPITPSSDFNQTPFTVQVGGINYNYYTTAEVYPVTVAGRQVHNISGEPGNKDGILGDGKVKFDGSSTLTLDNAEISVTTLDGKGIETSLEALTIDLKGTNSITSSGYSFYGTTGGTGSRTISLTSTSTPAGKLTLSSSTALAKDVTVSSTVYDLQAIDWNNSLNALIAKGFTGLTIAGTPITSDNIGTNGVISGVSGITSGTVSFAEAQSDPETPATLTLDNASITGDIKFNASLTVHLVGDNTITKPENSSYAFDLGNTARDLNFSTDETKPGTLKIVGSYSDLQNHGIVYYGQIEGGSSTIGTTGDAVIWKQTFSTTGVTPSYFILSLNKHYNLWKNGHQYHDLILDNNDGYVFNPEESTLTINSSSSADYINSGLEDLTIIVSGSQSLSYIAFGAPAGTQAEGITTGTLTITGKKDSESSSSSNSLSLSNSGGVITGFSPENITITLPMHVSYTNLDEFTGWTTSVTNAYITDEPDDYIFDEALTDGINYVTYYSLDRDLFLSNALTPSVITEISGSTVKTQALSYIPKKTPVLVTKATNTATTATFSKNLLKFAESDNPVTASEGKVLYVLYNDQFVKVTPGSEIHYAGYLDLTGVNLPANTRGLTIDGDDEGTTALREVKSEGVKGEKLADGEWYTLQGQRVTKPTKPGLYILNGKKVVIK